MQIHLFTCCKAFHGPGDVAAPKMRYGRDIGYRSEGSLAGDPGKAGAVARDGLRPDGRAFARDCPGVI